MMKDPSPTVNPDPSRVKLTLLLSTEVLLVFNRNANVKGMFLSEILVRESSMAYHARALKYTGTYSYPSGKHL